MIKKIELGKVNFSEEAKTFEITLNLKSFTNENDLIGIEHITKQFDKSDIEGVKKFFDDYGLKDNMVIEFIDNVWTKDFMELRSHFLS